MGLVGSKGLLDISQGNSPISNKNHVLSIDPRSPSEEFPRTPIAVEDQSPTMSNLNWLVNPDPRSPSIEFNRTPIPAELNLNNAIEDPRSPTAEVPRTPLEKATYDYIVDDDDRNNDLILDPTPPMKITTTPNFAILEEDNGNIITIETNGNYQRISGITKQLFKDDNSGSPRYPLGISNRPNSLRIRAQHNLHAAKMGSSLPNNNNNNKPIVQQMRQLNLSEALDKENSPVH